MLPQLRRAGVLLARTIDKCTRDNTPFLAAAISFYTILSIAPALWIVFAAAGAFIGRQSAHDAAIAWVSTQIGPIVALYLSQIIDQINESSRLATIGGTIATFVAATAAFGALHYSLGRIWNLPDRPAENLLASLKGFTHNYVMTRVMAFLVMLIFGGLLIASLLASAVLVFVARYMPSNLPAPGIILHLANFLVSVILMMVLFGSVYHLLHRKSFRRIEIWVGAAVTSVLFAIGNSLIGPYLGGAGLRSAYGAAGAFVLLILWVYYSTQIILFGAAFTEVYSKARRSG